MTNGALISIVDDDDSMRRATKRLVESVGLTVEDFSTAEEFLSSGDPENSACLILDVQLPGISGLDLQRKLAAAKSPVPIVFITGHGEGEVRARALEAGAVDFLQKPFSEKSLFKAIGPFTDMCAALPPRFSTSSAPGKETTAPSFSLTRKSRFDFEQIVADSPAMQEMLRLARRVAQSQVSSILLQGESGTGKDLVAKAIHYASNRAHHQFVAINCAALPPHLIESELFGYEKGAFTDAKARKEGLLEQDGGGGTVFLDEISELEISLQAKLLRVLEEGSFRRVGGLKEVPFSARVIAASNSDLKIESQAGRFRLDLYYRLAVIQIDIPALSDRGDDVLLLADYFISQMGNQNIKGLTPEVSRAFRGYDWPGNVRELRNVIERATVLEDGNVISTRYLPRGIVPDSGDSIAGNLRSKVVDADGMVNLPVEGIALSEVESSLLLQALTRAGGNQTRAAELLGLTRDQFRYRLKRLRESTIH